MEVHFICPVVFTGKHVIWYYTFSHDGRNFVPGVLGFILICNLYEKKIIRHKSKRAVQFSPIYQIK